jgi:KinB signaling pathway activation protein
MVLGGLHLNLKRWLFLFFTTLVIGAVSSLFIGLVLERNLWGQGAANAIAGLIGHFGLGMLFSLIAQMGFFAYLAIHNFGLGMFRGLWSGVQVILIGFTFFDLIYFRFSMYGQGEGITSYLGFPLAILFVAIITAYVKVKQTNSKAAIPTVFLMFVVSTIEWMPGLRVNQLIPMLSMLIPILCCNAWQVLQLHRLTAKASTSGRPSA